MSLHRTLTFLFTSIATGLAAAFVVLMLRPELISVPEPQPRTQIQIVPPAAPTPATAVPGNGPFSYADAVAAAAPSVVNIFAIKLSKGAGALSDNPLLRKFFGEQGVPKRRDNSLGSGVVVGSNGYILTNHHVVKGADEIRVVAANGEPVPARVVGVDPDTDLAVLQAAGDALPVARLGRSEELRVGDVVLAIGNPFAVGQTVTMGIVSATGRNRLGLTNFENFIQTDAAINPGNSGGALINPKGEVIGINTAIFTRSGGSQGIGFAIPMDLAKMVMRQIIEHGRVIRGWLGVSAQDLTPALAESFGLSDTTGVLIAGVLKHGPAHEAGVLPGDVMLSLDGKPVRNALALLNHVARVKPGDALVITALRDGKRLELKATAKERPTEVR